MQFSLCFYSKKNQLNLNQAEVKMPFEIKPLLKYIHQFLLSRIRFSAVKKIFTVVKVKKFQTVHFYPRPIFPK